MSFTAQHSSLERRRMRTNVSNDNLTAQHDNTWYRRGQAAYAGLNRTDPDAIWMYQGFAFVGWDSDEQASYVKGFVDSAPGRLIVIDMGYTDGEWQKWNNASFFGAPFIWTKLYNFGDTMGLRGDLHQINSAFPFQAQEAMSSIVGIGATPEGIDINPLYFDFLYEQNFRSVPVGDLTDHIIRVNHKRYALSMFDQDVAGAWQLLMKSSYSQDFSVQDQTGVAHLNPRPSGSLFHDDRMTPMPILCSIYTSWKQLLTASEKLQIETEPFLFDLVNVGREVLAQLTTPMALNFSDATSAQQLNSTILISTGTLYIQLLLDLDHLLSTNVAFRLRPWLESSRRLAAEDEAGGLQHDCFSPILSYNSHDDDDGSCERFYEWNARCQVTTWNPTSRNSSKIPGGPIDYAAKHWSGLIRDYYAKRAEILLQQSLQDQKRGQPLNSTEVQRLFAKHAFEWTTLKEKPYFLGQEGPSSLERVQKISREMIQKYSHWFETC